MNINLFAYLPVTDSCNAGSTVPGLPGHCCHTLNSVANQCPYLGGIAVYQARALLAWGSSTFLTYQDNCLDSAVVYIRQETPEAKVPAPQVRIYPNPARDEVFIYTEISARLEAYNLLGAHIASQQLSTGETRLSTEKWAAGTYLLRITLEGNHPTVHKVVIVK